MKIPPQPFKKYAKTVNDTTTSFVSIKNTLDTWKDLQMSDFEAEFPGIVQTSWNAFSKDLSLVDVLTSSAFDMKTNLVNRTHSAWLECEVWKLFQ